MLKTYCFDGQPHHFYLLEEICRSVENKDPKPLEGYWKVEIGHIFYCQKCLLKIEVLKDNGNVQTNNL